MTRVLRQLETGKRIEDLKPAYLGRVAYTVMVDEIRRRRRRRVLVPVETEAEVPETTTPTPEDALQARELGLAVKDCLASMLEARVCAVGLFLEGRGPSEIAATLGWNRKRADNLVRRGIADLRACLAGKGFTP